mmetsp:Transcript_6811/g.16436  ORF Transcript_6811/g.16436 Transcript_6811/m.16436 type:complete len:465 (-) Transcript_6811:2612-4006(-)
MERGRRCCRRVTAQGRHVRLAALLVLVSNLPVTVAGLDGWAPRSPFPCERSLQLGRHRQHVLAPAVADLAGLLRPLVAALGGHGVLGRRPIQHLVGRGMPVHVGRARLHGRRYVEPPVGHLPKADPFLVVVVVQDDMLPRPRVEAPHGAAVVPSVRLPPDLDPPPKILALLRLEVHGPAAGRGPAQALVLVHHLAEAVVLKLVVVGELLAGLDVPLGEYHDMRLACARVMPFPRLGIGVAARVEHPSEVALPPGVDHEAGLQLHHVEGGARRADALCLHDALVALHPVDDLAHVLADELALLQAVDRLHAPAPVARVEHPKPWERSEVEGLVSAVHAAWAEPRVTGEERGRIEAVVRAAHEFRARRVAEGLAAADLYLRFGEPLRALLREVDVPLDCLVAWEVVEVELIRVDVAVVWQFLHPVLLGPLLQAARAGRGDLCTCLATRGLLLLLILLCGVLAGLSL